MKRNYFSQSYKLFDVEISVNSDFNINSLKCAATIAVLKLQQIFQNNQETCWAEICWDKEYVLKFQ